MEGSRHLNYPLILFPGPCQGAGLEVELATGVRTSTHMEYQCYRQGLNSLHHDAGPENILFAKNRDVYLKIQKTNVLTIKIKDVYIP